MSTTTRQQGTRAKKQGAGSAPAPKKTGLATITEAAAYLRLHRSTVTKMIDSGQLTGVRAPRFRKVPWVEIYRLAGEEPTV